MKYFLTFFFCITTLGCSLYSQYIRYDSIYQAAHQTYNYVSCFDKDGLAIVEKKAHYGLINKTGEIGIPFIYDDIRTLTDNLYEVTLNNKIGIVSNKHKLIVPLQFEEIIYVNNNRFIVKQNDKYGIIDSTQTLLLPYEYKAIFIYDNGNVFVEKDTVMGILNVDLQTIIPTVYNSLYYNNTEERNNVFIHKNDSSLRYLYAEKQGKTGVIDNLNQTIIPFEYDFINEMLTKDIFLVAKKEKRGVIDKLGKTILPCIYTDITYDETNQYFIVADTTGMYGIADRMGNIVEPFKYNQIEQLSKDKYIVVIDSIFFTKKENIIDMPIVNGTSINMSTCEAIKDTANYVKEYKENYYILTLNTHTLSKKYDFLEVKYANKKAFVIAQDTDKYSVLDSTGNILIPPLYDNIELSYNDFEGRYFPFFSLKQKGLYGIANMSGKQITDCIYDKIDFNDNGHYIYLIKNKERYIAHIEKGLLSNDAFEDINSFDNLNDENKISFYVKKNHKMGVMLSNGEMLIPCKYEEITYINHLLFSILQAKKMALMSYNGKVITPFIYDYIHKSYKDNYIGIIQNKLVGLMDNTGNVILPCHYQNIEIKYHNEQKEYYIETKKDNNKYYFNLKGNPINEPIYQNKLIYQIGKGYGYLNNEKKELIPFVYDLPSWTSNCTFDSLGYIILGTQAYKGLINTNNEMVLPAIYQNIEVNENMIIVKQKNKFGIVDKQGKTILTTKYDGITIIPGYCLIRNNNKYGIFSQKGKQIIPILYEDITATYNNYFMVKQNNLYGVIDTQQRVIIPIIYDLIKSNLIDIYTAQKENNYYLLSAKGEIILQDKEMINVHVDVFKNIFYVQQKDNVLVYNHKGLYLGKNFYIFNDEIYDKCYIVKQFDKGILNKEGMHISSLEYYTRSSDGKCGLIDSVGNQLIPFIYDNILDKSDGYLSAIKNNKKYKLDKTGKSILSENFDIQNNFSHGLMAMQQANKWGFIDEKGIWKIKAEYELVSNFYEGKAVVYQQAKCGIIDTNGRLIVPIIYEGLEILYDGYLKAKIDCKFGILNPSGKAIVPIIYDFIGENNLSYMPYYEPIQWKKEIPKAHNANYFSYSHVAPQKRRYYDGFIVMQNNYFGFVDTTGKELIPCKYNSIDRNDSVYLIVRDTLNNYGVLNLNNEIIVPINYKFINNISNNIWFCEKKEGTYCFYHTKTKKKVEMDNQSFLKNADGEYIFAQKGKKYVINAAGDVWEQGCD